MFKHRISKEISIVICLKLIALTVLWKICFSDPIKPQLTTAKVTAQLLGNAV